MSCNYFSISFPISVCMYKNTWVILFTWINVYLTSSTIQPIFIRISLYCCILQSDIFPILRCIYMVVSQKFDSTWVSCESYKAYAWTIVSSSHWNVIIYYNTTSSYLPIQHLVTSCLHFLARLCKRSSCLINSHSQWFSISNLSRRLSNLHISLFHPSSVSILYLCFNFFSFSMNLSIDNLH